MTNPNTLNPAEAPSCCGGGCGAAATAPDGATAAALPAGARLFRIPTMDCAVEESEIRRALEPVAGVSGLRFRLGERSLAITAEGAALSEALAAIRKAGFKPEALENPAADGSSPAAAAAASTNGFASGGLLGRAGPRVGVRQPPPVQGAATTEVLGGLGYDAGEIAALRAQGPAA